LRAHQLVATVLANVIAFAACSRERPPDGVPEAATRVAFSKNGGWVYCWFDTTMQVNRCRTYNASGMRMYRVGKETDDDDVFLRYEGSGPVPEDQLQIDIVHTEPDFIWLENGVVLLPRNDYAHQKSVVDEINRIGYRPAENEK